MRYTGGKSKIGKKIAKQLKKYIGTHTEYIEPFCGALGVFKYMIKNDSNSELKYSAYDKCEDLIILFNELKNNSFEYFEVTKSVYDSLNNSKIPSAERAFAGFGCSYGGSFFGGFNEIRKDNGKRTDLIAYKSLKKIGLEKINKTIKFKSSDYKELEIYDSLIYCDPPYQNTKSSLNKCDFNHEEFWNKVRYWKKCGNTVIVSEYSAPEDFECIFELRRYSSLKKEYVIEKLFIQK